MNDHFNDVKHAALVFQTGVISDHISDAELAHVHNQIINPTKNGHIGGAWHQYWTEQGIEAGHYNDRAKLFIKQVLPLEESEDINQLWLSYWTSLLP